MLNTATSFPWLSSATLFCSQPSVMQNTVWLGALRDTPDLICQNEANLGIFGEGNLEDWSKSYSNHSFFSFCSVWLVIRYRQRHFILNTRLDLDLYNNWQTLLDNWAKETGRQMQRSGNNANRIEYLIIACNSISLYDIHSLDWFLQGCSVFCDGCQDKISYSQSRQLHAYSWRV